VTGLSTSAVSTLVADLIEAKVLVELGTKASGAGGRPAVALGLAPRAGSLVGIHVGHADLRVVLTYLDGTVLMQQRHFLSRNGLTPTVDDNEAAPRGAIWARTLSRPRTTARVQKVRGSQLAKTGSPSRTAQRPRPPARTPRTRMTRALADGQPKDAPRTSPLRFGLAAPTATTHRETKRCAYVDFRHFQLVAACDEGRSAGGRRRRI
jgi:hypothetical protein